MLTGTERVRSRKLPAAAGAECTLGQSDVGQSDVGQSEGEADFPRTGET